MARWAAATAALAALPAALLAVTLWDRTSLAGLSRQWAGTFLLAAAALFLWTLLPQSRHGRALSAAAALGLLPAAVIAGALVLAVYVSEDVHHAFVYRPLLKGLALPIVTGLAVAAPWLGEAIAAGQAGGLGARLGAVLIALRRELAGHELLLVGLTVGATGVLQALSFCAIATDDSIRYWAVADGLRSGAGYPVTTGTAGSGGFYLVELPLYPLLLVPSFAIAGHRFFALELPLIVANVILPYVLYAIGRATGTSRLWALLLALVVLCSPYYQAYALGAAQPEALLAVGLGVAMLLAIRLTLQRVATNGSGDEGRWHRRLKPPATPAKPAEAGSPRPRPQGVGQPPSGGFAEVAGSFTARRWWPREYARWALLGLACAAAILTRPEGVLYVAPLFAGLAWTYRRSVFSGRSAGLWLAAAVCAVPVAAFSAFLWSRFGIVWPAGWTNVAGPRFVADNLRLVWRQDLPHYAAAAGLPVPAITGPSIALLVSALTLVGLWRLCGRWPSCWFVPVALLLNVAVILVSPTFLTPDLFSPGTFFRHLSVLVPWLVPAWAAVLTKDERRKTNRAGGDSSFVLRPSSFVTAAAAFVLAWEVAILGTSAARNQAQAPTVLTSDPYVLVADLLRVDDALPMLPFTTDARGAAAVDEGFDYLAMRRHLFDAVRPHDLHVNDAGEAYALATGVLALAGLGAVAIARAAPHPI